MRENDDKQRRIQDCTRENDDNQRRIQDCTRKNDDKQRRSARNNGDILNSVRKNDDKIKRMCAQDDDDVRKSGDKLIESARKKQRQCEGGVTLRERSGNWLNRVTFSPVLGRAQTRRQCAKTTTPQRQINKRAHNDDDTQRQMNECARNDDDTQLNSARNEND